MTIATRFRRTVIALSLLGLAVLALDQAWVSRRLLERSTERRAAVILESVSEFTASDLRAGRTPDPSHLKHFADLPGVRFLGLYGPGGTPLMELVPASPRPGNADVLAFSGEVRDAHGPLADVRLRMSREHVDRGVARLLAHGFILSVLVVAVLGGVAGFLGGRLGSYLEGFAQAVDGLSPGDLPPIPPRFRDSELARIEKAFTDLSDRLGREQRLREEVSRQKDEMAAMLVHDLKHPLTVLNTILLIQRDPGLEAGTRERRDEHLRMATRALGRLNSMIEDILHIARLRDASTEVPKELVRLEGLLEEFTDENRLIVESSGRAFRVLGNPRTFGLRAYVNARLIKRLVGNLVLNAIENSPQGAEITLGLDLSPTHPGRVSVWVHNTGSSIPPNELRLVFERYFTSGRSPRNVGLGLSFCKLAADAHGGVLSAESDSEGTRFSLALSYVPPGEPDGLHGGARVLNGAGAELSRRAEEAG